LKKPRTDERYVYGACCTWHGSIMQVVHTGSGLPGCPYCYGVLYEMPSKESWDQSVSTYADKANDPGYVDFVQWMGNCGKCYPLVGPNAVDLSYVRAEYERAHIAKPN